jgi:hypothetical protein
MKQLFALLLILSSLTLTAQNFAEFIRIGDQQYSEGNFEASAQSYEQAFALEEGNASQYYNAACSWALAGNTDKATVNLILSVDKGWINLAHLERDTDLESLHDLPTWAPILATVAEKKAEFEKDFDFPLKDQLEEISMKDQTLRGIYEEITKKYGFDSPEKEYFNTLWAQEDSLLLLECIDIIEEHGWVGRSKVGRKANTALFLVIQHAPLEAQEKYISLLQASVEAGESSGSHLALMQDRILMRKDQPQIYGSQVSYNPETGEGSVFEIQDPEYVNQRRKSIGLGPIEDYLKNWDIEWTVPQKEK